MKPILLAMLAAAPAENPATERAFGAMALLGIVACLLVIFLVLLTVMNIAHRQQRRRRQREAEAAAGDDPQTDAWVEAGRRVDSDSRG